MAKINPSLAQFLAAGVLALLAVMLPVLFYSLDRIVAASNQDSFVNYVRASTRILVEQFETSGLPASDAELVNVLDGLALSGDISSAEFMVDGRILRSRLSAVDMDGKKEEDYEFGAGGDDTYLVSAIVPAAGRRMELRLGFDETPAKERIATARRELLLTLSAYLLASIAAAFLLSRLLARPVRQLQAASREIASGNLATQLTVPTGIREMGALAADLDTMRSALVGTTLRLQQQMEERVTLEAQLRHKQRLETVGTLAGGIAHEINNVLVPITLRTEMAMDALPPEHPAYADLAVVLGASRRARDTVSKVLSFARHFDISPPQHLNIAPAVEEALHLIHTVKPASVNVVADIDHNCGDVLADSGSIVHIVLNLCSNALQAMHDAGGQLLVRLDQYAAADRKYTRLQVIDNGPGMDAATQERMFEPFFTTREVGMGTGLGLAVVHGIATALNASIQVQSAPQRGTTFAVLFPC